MTPSLDDRILIVDDEPANVLLMERLLRDAGYRNLSSTTDSRRVLGLYREVGPDLILLDLMMPVMDAFAFRSELARRGQMDGCAVLVVSAAPNLDQAVRRLEATDAIAKPFTLDVLLDRVEALLAAGVGRERRAGPGLA